MVEQMATDFLIVRIMVMVVITLPIEHPNQQNRLRSNIRRVRKLICDFLERLFKIVIAACVTTLSPALMNPHCVGGHFVVMRNDVMCNLNCRNIFYVIAIIVLMFKKYKTSVIHGSYPRYKAMYFQSGETGESELNIEYWMHRVFTAFSL